MNLTTEGPKFSIVWAEGETRRKCGSCQLCCKLVPLAGDNAKSTSAMLGMIEDGKATPDEFKGMVREFEKPAGARCKHQKHGKGCAIYAKRPFSCRMWTCRWLVEDDTEGLSRPDHAHYVIDVMPDVVTAVPPDGEPVELLVIQVWIDPRFPDAHRDPALRAYLERRGLEGYAALIRYSAEDALTLIPPNMTADKQWHEHKGMGSRAHGLFRS